MPAKPVHIPSWAFDPNNSAAIAGWGFWLAIVGMVLTLVGFAITLAQLKKTKSSAEAAEQESIRIRNSFNRYEITNELAKASTSLNTTKNYIRHGLWLNVADNYQIVLSSLEALKDDANDLTVDHISRIDTASKYIQNLCSRIERDHDRGSKTINSAKALSVIVEHQLLVSELTRVVEKGVVS